jgi:hypothetical protein
MKVPEMATMTNAPYFDEDTLEAGIADGEVRAMAHRQFGISLVVAFALLAVAGLIAVRAPREETIAATSVHHKIVEAPQFVTARPVMQAMNRQQ